MLQFFHQIIFFFNYIIFRYQFPQLFLSFQALSFQWFFEILLHDKFLIIYNDVENSTFTCPGHSAKHFPAFRIIHLVASATIERRQRISKRNWFFYTHHRYPSATVLEKLLQAEKLKKIKPESNSIVTKKIWREIGS